MLIHLAGRRRPFIAGCTIQRAGRVDKTDHRTGHVLRWTTTTTLFLVQIMKNVMSIKQCDSGLSEKLSQMRELYRREALQRKLLYNQVIPY